MGENIRLRAALAVIKDGKILLVPHFNTDAGPVQWNIPGGTVEKIPQWFSLEDLTNLAYHPAETIQKALIFCTPEELLEG